MRSINNGFPTFVQRDHIYPVYEHDKAIRDAEKILNRVEDNAIIFTDWDKLYSMVYTAHIENGRRGISLHEWLPGDALRAQTAIAYIDDNLDKRPIYFAFMTPQLSESYWAERINDSLYRIHRK